MGKGSSCGYRDYDATSDSRRSWRFLVGTNQLQISVTRRDLECIQYPDIGYGRQGGQRRRFNDSDVFGAPGHPSGSRRTKGRAVPEVLLINPNSNQQTTREMAHALTQALEEQGAVVSVRTATAARGPSMIVDDQALTAAAREVLPLTIDTVGTADAVVVAAFGDPGVEALRSRLRVPVLGIGEASMTEAASAGRSFGIATTTPGLAQSIDARVRQLGFQNQYTGLRLTVGDPTALQGDRLRQELRRACEVCIVQDGAQAVLIGGGPLGGAADQLSEAFNVPVINAVSATARRLLKLLAEQSPKNLPSPHSP